MPFEQRMRDGLRSAADPVDADVERSLHRVMTARRRPGRPRVAARIAALTAALAALLLMAGIPVLHRLRSDDRAADPAGGGTLIGYYEVRLAAADVAAADGAMAGTWRLRLRADGVVELTPPDGFAARAGQSGLPCTASSAACRYSDDGAALRTNLQLGPPGTGCNSIGTYSWRLERDRLTLRADEDDCRARRALLASRAWTDLADPRLPEGVYRTAPTSLPDLSSARGTGMDAARLETFWRGRGVSRDAQLTLRLEAGLWTLLVSADGGAPAVALTGRYEVTANGSVRIVEAAVACGAATLRFRLDADELRLDAVASGCGADAVLRLAALHQSAPFVRQR